MNRPLILTLALALGFSPWTRAVDIPPPPRATTAPVALDPAVNNILTSTTSYYAARKSVECDITSTTMMTMTGMKQQMDSSFHLALQRPNFFAFTIQSGVTGGSLVSDGKTLVTFESVILKKYTSKPAPADISDILEPMNFIMVGGGLPLGFEPFFRKDPFATFQQDLKSSRDLGLEKSGDVQAHHIQMANRIYITDLWIADGPSPLLLQAVVTQDLGGMFKLMSDAQKKKLPAGASTMTMSRTTTYSNWKLDQPVTPDTFVFHPPAEAQLVTDFARKLPTPPAPNAPAPATSPTPSAASASTPAVTPITAPSSTPAATTTATPPSTQPVAPATATAAPSSTPVPAPTQ